MPPSLVMNMITIIRWRAKKLGQCPRNERGQKSWGNAPEKEKRQMIGSEEENAPVVCRFSVSQNIYIR
jgi:hypothetical protein